MWLETLPRLGSRLGIGSRLCWVGLSQRDLALKSSSFGVVDTSEVNLVSMLGAF